MTIPLQQNIVYGPVHSRRLGLSLGINLMPSRLKLCSFNCIYCQYGWTTHQEMDLKKFLSELPTVEEVVRAVEAVLRSTQRFSYLTFSGNGESTLHPHFAEIVHEIVQLRNRLRPEVQIALLSNGSGLFSEKVRRAVARIDRPILKLDAGEEATFRLVNRPHRTIRFADLVSWFAEIPHCYLQSLFFQGEISNASPDQLDPYYQTVATIHPREVQVYTLDRGTPFRKIFPLSEEQLEAIARNGKQKTGINFRAYN